MSDDNMIRRPAGPNPLAGLLTTAEVARMKKVNPRYVNACIYKGVLPAWTIAGIYLIPESEVEHWHPGSQSYRHNREGPLRCVRCGKRLVRTRLLKVAPDYCSLDCAGLTRKDVAGLTGATTAADSSPATR